jgi:hypothetical protein
MYYSSMVEQSFLGIVTFEDFSLKENVSSIAKVSVSDCLMKVNFISTEDKQQYMMTWQREEIFNLSHTLTGNLSLAT